MSENYGDESMVKKFSELFWIDIFASEPRQKIFNIEEHVIESDDRYFNPGFLNLT